MSTTRFLAAVGFTLSLMLFASPASAKDLRWYTERSCQFYPGGGPRTPAETAECRRQKAVAGEVLRFCRDQARRGPLPCGPNQATVWTAVR
jgi:hypothetical protein